MDPNDRAQKKPPPRSQRQSQPQNAKRQDEAKDYGKLSGNDNRSILSSGTAATMETAAAAALLDRQIAGQRQKGVMHAASNGNGNANVNINANTNATSDRSSKQKAKAARKSAVASGAYRKPPPPGSTGGSGASASTNSASSAADATARDMSDAMAKSRGRRSAKHQHKRPAPVRPTSSAIEDSNSNSNSNSKNATKLERLEEEVAAKARGRAPKVTAISASVTKRNPSVLSSSASQSQASSIGSSFTAVTRLNRMEADIAAKEKARAGRVSGKQPTATATASSSNSNRLNRLEADVAAKERARAGRTTGKRDDVIARKLAKTQQQRTAPATVPGAVSSTGGGNRASIIAKKMKDAASASISAAGAATAESGSRASAILAKKSSSPVSRSAARVAGGDKQVKHPTTSSNANTGLVEAPQLVDDRNQSLDDKDKEDSNDGLAVAVAVHEEDVFIPSAVEYDPDAIKLPVYRNQRFRVYGLLGCILLIIVTACSIGVLAILEQQQLDDQGIPTDAPTCARCTMDYMEQLELEVGSQKLNDPTSPEYLAKEWIIHDDAAQVEPTDLNFIQRFLVATFYFDTHQVGNWRSCNQQSLDPSDNETEACEFLKVSGIDPLEFEPFPAQRWLSSVHECEWAGVTCDDLKNIRLIDLHGQDIQGTFPESFSKLRYIQTVGMQWNRFTGPLPESFGRMKHLIHIEMHNNEFTGTFPNSWSSARNLQLLNVAGNFLTGQIPSSIGDFRNIKGMFLYKNQLSGTLPPECARARSLAFMRFHKNALKGTIPTEFGNMHINELWLHGNSELTGTIPTELGKLSNYLTDLRLSDTSLEGTIPDEIYDMGQLWRLDLYRSSFTGTISSNITKLENLQSLRISGNGFTGTVPAAMSAMTNLRTVWLDGNMLTGSISSSICNLKEEHMLEYLQADCLPDPSTGQPLVTCECCDVCCSAETGACSY